MLNLFFRAYHDSHSRGGTNTKQRNLRHLFTWLEATCDHPHPWTSISVMSTTSNVLLAIGPRSRRLGTLPVLDGQVHPDTLVMRMHNYVIGGEQ